MNDIDRTLKTRRTGIDLHPARENNANRRNMLQADLFTQDAAA